MSMPPTPWSRCHISKMSPGVRTQMAELITVVPPMVRACTTGQKARPMVMVLPQSSNSWPMEPWAELG